MPNKNSETCSICSNQIRSDTYHLCSNFEKRSHAKWNNTEPKVIKNLWLCKLCKTKAFPFCDLSEQLPIGKDISSLKSYFNHLNVRQIFFNLTLILIPTRAILMTTLPRSTVNTTIRMILFPSLPKRNLSLAFT